ncbi:MAG TPA: sulfide/dihydroorotate dehydrogenase-like FAD/NAD-binding protein [Candidatus Omnitrophota bacterium]|nr:sulfide/dihydroorotate dehydrogenase-like FAD/NAD-binding protein [Candidatus Omnitrophota bacterium]
MYRIIEKERVNPVVNRFVIEAPLIARKREPGQFVIFRLDEEGERFPITIADADPEKGTITVYVQEIGKTTTQMGRFKTGDSIANVAGPLGTPTPIEKMDGEVFLVAGGVGAAEIFPIARKHKVVGNKIIVILGARSKEILILEKEFRSFADEVHITTDDGTAGRKGFVTDELKTHIERGRKIAEVLAVGPVFMMKSVCDLTRGYGIKTLISLNTIMIDGTGMCGGCRVEYGGETRYTCVDGPEFDGHKINFDLLIQRLGAYKTEEKKSHDCYLAKAEAENSDA